MAEAYCVKEKTKREMSGAHEVHLRNGRRAIEGSCPSCGIKLFRILGSNEDWNGGGTSHQAKAEPEVKQGAVQCGPDSNPTISLNAPVTEFNHLPDDPHEDHSLQIMPAALLVVQQPQNYDLASQVVTYFPLVPVQGTPPINTLVNLEADKNTMAVAGALVADIPAREGEDDGGGTEDVPGPRLMSNPD